MVARKGFAWPAWPVAWGRRPTPTPDLELGSRLDAKPVGCVFRSPLLPRDPVGLCLGACWLRSGVVGADWGIGGSDSRSAAPNDDDGLNGLRAEKPVV